MSVKSFIGKIFGKKQSEEGAPAGEQTEVQHEISFAKTIVEPSITNKAKGEVEIFINNEKTNIYDIYTETRVGRDPSQTEISIPELIVSKRHCTMYIKDGAVYIKDDGSTNGTFVNREKISDCKLNNKDEIMLGKKGTVRLVFHTR